MQPKWEIPKTEFLQRLGLDEKSLGDSLCPPDIPSTERVVPLRNLVTAHSIVPIKIEFLKSIVRKIRTLDGEAPFSGAEIELGQVDPSSLLVGQKFVYRENYTNLLENVTKIFRSFALGSGLNELGAYFVFGRDTEGSKSMSFYTPPWIERHIEGLVVMDGMHRNYIAKQFGGVAGTMRAMIISESSVPFPCSLSRWENVNVIPLSEKPKNIEDRYFDLCKGRFRDLKYLGIDG